MSCGDPGRHACGDRGRHACHVETLGGMHVARGDPGRHAYHVEHVETLEDLHEETLASGPGRLHGMKYHWRSSAGSPRS